jgi:NAD(P)-dependent dehydrogenase (short-subunit alcohol dehydrogenase family)
MASSSTPSTRRDIAHAGVTHHHSAACHAHDADYAESKLAMVLLARALSRGDLGRKVDGVPVNPGAANSDIWRHVWAPFQPVFHVLVAPVFLTTDQACASSVAAAALPLARDGDGLPLYLAPYWVPRYGCRAAFEYVGYFVGSGSAFARVPSREHEAAEALFARCRGLLADT